VSQRVNPSLVGGFVVGAIALLVVAVTVFGSGRCFRPTVPVMLTSRQRDRSRRRRR
jgi:paraquat-inducible protein B